MNAARKNYRNAYRAVRLFWKAVDQKHSGTDDFYRCVSQRYEVCFFAAALDSIRNRREAEYAVEHPELRHFKPAQEAPYSADNLPF